MKIVENMQVWKKKTKLALGGFEQGTLERISSSKRLNHWTTWHLVFEKVGIKDIWMMTRPDYISNWVSHAWTPCVTSKRIRASQTSTRAVQLSTPKSTPELGLRSSSPIAWKNKTRKTRGINGKGGPYPPKSMAANPLVASVSIENTCSYWFEAWQFEMP